MRHILPGLHLRIALQLAACGLLVSVIAGVGVYRMEMARLDTFVRQLAEDQARYLIGHIGGQDNRHSADDLLSGFVFAEIALPNNGETEVLQQTDLPSAVRTKLDRLRQNTNNEPNDEHRDFTLDGHSYMYLLFTAADAGSRFSGLFRVSDTLASRLSRQVLGSVIGVIGIVLATTLILIPVIGKLERQVLRHAHDAIDANIDALATLGGAIAKRDSDTDAHNYRVTLYAVRLAEVLGLGRSPIQHLIQGAFLHDVGKIAIPDAILLKPGRLTGEEFEIMKSHVRHGLDIVGRSRWLSPATEVIGCHHEKFDGSGYPRGLAGRQIPLSARIFTIVDVYDALTSKRPYKDALPPSMAYSMMVKERGRHFDPLILDRFLSIVDDVHHALNGVNAIRSHELLQSEIMRYFG